ncbi:DEAD/DEAH box helicase [Tuwongella immobilis]|uniref:Uncharacterized protein n=1 Tax=Tuwongella immobilis TaxID=692036 RepID=A0A6C2YTK6_9BACT|nr:DEAD/DEAH box helicase family protein [Tuwongella immobilis]VIP04806.1 atp-dependent helicase : Type III restriction protein res subunit OS=Isosphaera pallida (strain ATCC 43644 / DSM 9630 / IS1B) GN=Isop_2393 PE=4 SV=1: ResIII: Helicase_C [Tuwongella immobilis]VTS06972.1 atp-dependent helicase : Type III restriction protein res subunit OS=Isosphaera pallida (strain ATCC 43644 / DSM 9630 / IS1B) GN=Isop_2393 PE=4 SV=1: ResIII: Helicase_C [Tuwongella immobilis]
MDALPITLAFDGGTLLLTGPHADELLALPGVRYDPRTSAHRAEAKFYRRIVEQLRAQKRAYTDQARQYQPTPWKLTSDRTPRDYQAEAIEEWWNHGGCGVVVLPTGSGKTFTAMVAIQRVGRPSLIVTPTIDLLHQWHEDLSRVFGVEIGAMGGGSHEIREITVTTYDSAFIHFDRIGNRFGLLVFDEAHHLPSDSYSQIALGCIAPFRLGITATPERSDAREEWFPELIGPIVYRRELQEFAGEYLAEYQTRRIYVDLSAEEQEQYRLAREKFRGYISSRNLSLGGGNGWQRFIFEAMRNKEGWEAFQAYQLTKRLERAASAKLETLSELLMRHANDRVIVFTADNATVYAISRRFLVPAITHQTKAKEREKILAAFHSGEYPVVVTSRVLNEGVDVPAASVGIVLSGTSSTRENVQRLGRLLRKFPDKQAIMYEIVSRGTTEEFASDRRRQHGAFR